MHCNNQLIHCLENFTMSRKDNLMLRIATLSAIVLASTVMQACVPEGDDPSYGSIEPALEASEQPALDITTLPAGSRVLEGMPPGAVVAEIPPSATCPSGTLCIFQNSNGKGARLSISLPAGVGINLTSIPCGSCTNGTHGNDGTWNDQMSSWENVSGVRYCWAVNINGGGARHPMRTGVGLQNVLPSRNDEASSIDRLGC
jgi:hypothetical protein